MGLYHLLPPGCHGLWQICSHLCPTTLCQPCWHLLLEWVSLWAGNDTGHFPPPICISHEIQHFFCDMLPVLSLACRDTGLSELGILTLSLLVILVSFSFITISYTWQQSWGSPPMRGGRSPSLLAPHTSQWSLFTMAVPPSCTWDPKPVTLLSGTSLLLSSILWWLPSSIPLFIV